MESLFFVLDVIYYNVYVEIPNLDYESVYINISPNDNKHYRESRINGNTIKGIRKNKIPFFSSVFA